MTSNATTTPALPHLYFSSFSGVTAAPSSSPSLQTLPPELLHACLAEYSDWGDLAKLACVQRGRKSIVDDAAMYGGLDAMWELNMCLLYGDDSRRRLQQQQSEDDTRQTTVHVYDNDWNNSTVAIPTNSRGLEKNEALAVRYLTRLCGVEQEVVIGQSHGEPITSVLPSNEIEQYTTVIADEAALLELASCYLTGTGVSQPNPNLAIKCLMKRPNPSANSNGLIDIDVEAAAINGHVTSAVFGEEDGVGGLQQLVEVAHRVVPRVRVYRELGCYLY